VDLIDSNLEATGMASLPVDKCGDPCLQYRQNQRLQQSPHDEWVPIGLADRAAVRKPNKRATKRDN
jgi:hypothetical protein